MVPSLLELDVLLRRGDDTLEMEMLLRRGNDTFVELSFVVAESVVRVLLFRSEAFNDGFSCGDEGSK